MIIPTFLSWYIFLTVLNLGNDCMGIPNTFLKTSIYPNGNDHDENDENDENDDNNYNKNKNDNDNNNNNNTILTM